MKSDPCLIPYIKINSKWVKDLNIRPENVKSLEENIEKTLLDLVLARIFGYDPRSTGSESRSRQIRLQQTEELLRSTGNNQQSEEPTYGMVENICKPYIR